MCPPRLAAIAPGAAKMLTMTQEPPTGRGDLVLVRTYLAQRGKRGAAAREEAWEEVDRRVRSSSEEGWSITKSLLAAAADDAELMYVAAGPLEDLLHLHGEAIVDEVVNAARRDPKIRRALGGVWGATSMKPRVVAAIRRILGPVE
jgi:hypothetical protein